MGAALAALMLVPLFELFFNSGDYERRLERPPGHALAKYLGAMFLFDYWGRPTQTSLVADLVSNRGFYAGAVTLMLAAVGLILRPTAMRVAIAVFGALCLAVVVGVEPLFSILTALPGFRTAHNGRMVIFVLFALALLAGLGLDELSSPRARPTGPPAAWRWAPWWRSSASPSSGCSPPARSSRAALAKPSRWPGGSPTRWRRSRCARAACCSPPARAWPSRRRRSSG